MGQSRNKTGVDFEKLICESKGWKHTPASPRIVWSGDGKTTFKKIASIDFDPTKFYPTTKSVFEKYDAITDKGEKVEIKKYTSTQLKEWSLYSEPIFKVASRESVTSVSNIFGGGDLNRAIEKYNNFIDGITTNIGQDFLDNITRSNIGVQLIDDFIPQTNLEYRWVIRKGWMGFNRLSIEFRIKD